MTTESPDPKPSSASGDPVTPDSPTQPIQEEKIPGETIDQHGGTATSTPAHEPLSISIRGLTISMIALVVLVIVTIGLMAGLYKIFDEYAGNNTPEVPELRDTAKLTDREGNIFRDPNDPVLDPNQPVLMRENRQEQMKWLSSGDEETGRIPLQEARQKALKTGLGNIKFANAVQPGTEENMMNPDGDSSPSESEEEPSSDEEPPSEGDSE